MDVDEEGDEDEIAEAEGMIVTMIPSDVPVTGRGELIILYAIRRINPEDGHEVTPHEAHEIFAGIYDDFCNRLGVPITIISSFCQKTDTYYGHLYEGYEYPQQRRTH